MPVIRFKNRKFSCVTGENLRAVLLAHKSSPYNRNAAFLNCRGLGTCGTCAVEVRGSVSAKTKIEKWRVNFPPHKEENGLRLACQCKVLGDVEVVKHNGFWGEKMISSPVSDE